MLIAEMNCVPYGKIYSMIALIRDDFGWYSLSVDYLFRKKHILLIYDFGQKNQDN